MSADLRERALSEARSWIGTPYRAQASCKGAGADCLGLVRGVWRVVCGAEPEPPPPYTPDWAERARAGCKGADPLLDAARRHLQPLPKGVGEAGDVVLFRYAPDRPAKHCGILCAPLAGPQPRMIHALQDRCVCQSALTPWWRRRIAGVFRFTPSSGG